jgi:hypothetical protein
MAAGDKIGFAVFKGYETFTRGQEFLTYGLDEDFLKDFGLVRIAGSDAPSAADVRSGAMRSPSPIA